MKITRLRRFTIVAETLAVLAVATLMSYSLLFPAQQVEAQAGLAKEGTTAAAPLSVKTADGTTVNFRGITQFVFPTGRITRSGRTITVAAESASAALNFDLTSVASQDLTITLTGAALGDTVALGVPNASVTADTVFFAWVSAANTVKVRALRIAGTPDPASGTFTVKLVK